MKKILALMLTAAMGLSLTACGGGGGTGGTPKPDNVDDQGNVQITMDCSYANEDEALMFAERFGLKDHTLNENRTMTFWVEKEDREAYLEDWIARYEEELLRDSDDPHSSEEQRIEYSFKDGASVFDIYADGGTVSYLSNALDETFFEYCKVYQAYYGYDYDTKVIVNLVDLDTKGDIYTENSHDVLLAGHPLFEQQQ